MQTRAVAAGMVGDDDVAREEARKSVIQTMHGIKRRIGDAAFVTDAEMGDATRRVHEAVSQANPNQNQNQNQNANAVVQGLAAVNAQLAVLTAQQNALGVQVGALGVQVAANAAMQQNNHSYITATFANIRIGARNRLAFDMAGRQSLAQLSKAKDGWGPVPIPQNTPPQIHHLFNAAPPAPGPATFPPPIIPQLSHNQESLTL
ncbi:hypothetical protein HDU79_005115, partial [Rhizoclosmatium sp. JEL0117]